MAATDQPDSSATSELHPTSQSVYTISGLYAAAPVSDCSENENSVCELLEHPEHKCTKCCNIEEDSSSPEQKPSSVPQIYDDCGILGCRPRCLQSLASIKVFVLLLSVLVTLQQALSSGYLNSVITTIEKRFEIPSSQSGLIASTYEIGNVITVIFVSYLGSRRHIPVWIGIGTLVIALGSIIFVLPHFLVEPYTGSTSDNASQKMNICNPPVKIRGPGVEDLGLGTLSKGFSPDALAPHNNLHTRGDNCIEGSISNAPVVAIFMLAQLLLGCGGSPLFTLGTTYIDDHVKRKSASVYIGCVYCMIAFGPVCGFLLGAYLLSFHVDLQPYTLKSNDASWIGLWWGGFLICGLLLILVALPFFAFPKTLKSEKLKLKAQTEGDHGVELATRTQTHRSSNSQKRPNTYGSNVKDIPKSMLRLLYNPVYVVTCLGACMELIIVSGFIVFLPKYLETQFNLSKSQASVFTGGFAIPGACIGIFMGGCLLQRFQLRPKGAVAFVLITNTLCLGLYGLLFFLGCDNVKMAGTTMPYFNHTKPEPFSVNLTASCNFGCECDTSDIEPVCGSNGITYFSPCHAGCTMLSSQYNYTNCTCILSSSTVNSSVSISTGYADVLVVPVATAGPCVSQCHTILPFMVLLFVMTLIVAISQMPLLMIVLRSVDEEERSFALGMQFVIFRLFGYIPSPIMFGNIIDSTCLLWKSTCGERGGRCLIYDIELFRYKYVGICAGIKLVSVLIFLLDWNLIRRADRRKKEGAVLDVTGLFNSIISLDKLFEDGSNQQQQDDANQAMWLPAEEEKSEVSTDRHPHCVPDGQSEVTA